MTRDKVEKEGVRRLQHIKDMIPSPSGYDAGGKVHG